MDWSMGVWVVVGVLVGREGIWEAVNACTGVGVGVGGEGVGEEENIVLDGGRDEKGCIVFHFDGVCVCVCFR